MLRAVGKLDRLLDDAAEAVERADWATALHLADEIVGLDAGNEDAAAIRTLARLRSSRPPLARRGARRQITILFADIVDSTGMASRLDPEETRDALLAFQALCGEVVGRFDGHIAQFIGDGVLVYFGHPRAHEDDAVRAVMTGLEIVRRVGEQPPGTAGGSTAPPVVAVRVGIHTGLVVIADMGVAGRVQPNDVVGEAPNVAARLHVGARPGTVVMSAETYELVRGLIDAAVLPPVTIRGIDRPVRLFEAIGERTGESRFDAAGRPRGVLIGRQREQEEIIAAWAGVQAEGGTEALAVVGEPGIGKSRLAAFAKEHVHSQGGIFRTLQCSPYHLATPLYPFSVAFQREARRSPQSLAASDRIALDDPADRYALARLLGQPQGEPPPGLELSPEELRERIFTVALAGTRRLAVEAPLLLVVEDLHWADPTTLELLARLLRGPAGAPAPILAVFTSRERDPVERVGALPVIELGPLPAGECDQLVADIAPPELGDSVRRLIVEHGGGVPLFLEELTRMLAETPATPEVGELSIPPTLQDLLVARVDQFTAEHRLAQVIATFGQPVQAAMLRRLAEVDAEDVDHQLQTLVAAGLIEGVDREGERFYQFRHALQRDAAYRLQLHSTRRTTHAAVAVALAEDAQLGRVPAELMAHHYERADDLNAAAQEWYTAAVRHAEAAAHAEAVELYRRALNAVHLTPVAANPDLELDVQAGLAVSLLETRGYTSAEVADAYARLRALLGDGGTGAGHHHLGSLYGLWAYYHVRGENRTSGQLATQLLQVAEQSGSAGDVLAAKAVLGHQLMWMGRFGEAAVLLEDARRFVSAPGGRGLFPHDTGVGACVNLAATLWTLGRFGPARQALAEGVARAEALAGPQADFTRAYVHCFAAAQRYVAGDFDGCRVHGQRAVQISNEHGYPSWLGAGLLMVTVAAALTEDPDQYIPGIRYGLDAWRNAGAETNRTLFLLGLAQASARAGRPEEGVAAVDEALAQASGCQELYLISALLGLRGELMAVSPPGDPKVAETDLENALEVARKQGAVAFELAALARIARLSLDEGRRRAAAAQLERLSTSLELGRDDEPCLVEARSVLEQL